MSTAVSAGSPARSCTIATVFAVLLVVPPTMQLCAPRAHTRERTLDHRALLGGVERRRFAGGCEGDEARGAGVDVLVGEALECVQRHRAVGRERCDQRDVEPLEQPRHGREDTPASSRARSKIASSMGSVSLPVNVFC